MSTETLLTSLGEAQRKHLDPSSPMPMRMMAAKGMVPLAPRDMVIVLAGLSVDANEKLSDAARKSLTELPDKLLGPALAADLPSAALGLIAPLLKARDAMLEQLVLNRQTPDEAIAVIAEDASTPIAQIIAANQERCLRSAAIVFSLRRNPNLSKSQNDLLFDFLVRAGVIYDDMPEFDAALARLSPTEMTEAAEKVKLPDSITFLLQNPHAADRSEDERAESIAKELDGKERATASERIPVLKLIAGLNSAQKISLAIKGNKEARAILVRDSNKVVSAAAIRSPAITEPEIVAAARSRSVSDEVIRIIARSKEMVRSYSVKLSLVENPKTPQVVAMQFLSLLRANDLRTIAKSKNISSAVAMQAKRLLSRKR